MSLSGNHYHQTYHQTEEKEQNIMDVQIMMNLAKYLAEEKLITPDERVRLLELLRGEEKE
ncbi:MAG: hypothetical protein SPE99_08415 [Blautia sp.]|nr:hypothetical protein [Blautia sp.]